MIYKKLKELCILKNGYAFKSKDFSQNGVPVIKIKNVKQSDLNFEQRKHIIEALMFDETFDIRNKKILIVDDVFTTGSTMSAMIKLIKEHHPKKIQFLTMSIVLNSSRNHIKK